MITEKLEKLIMKYKITKVNNIIYGTNIPMPKRVMPTPWNISLKLFANYTISNPFSGKNRVQIKEITNAFYKSSVILYD